jgi:hypothetical protein
MNQHAQLAHLIHMHAMDFDVVNGGGVVEYLVGKNCSGAGHAEKLLAFG